MRRCRARAERGHRHYRNPRHISRGARRGRAWPDHLCRSAQSLAAQRFSSRSGAARLRAASPRQCRAPAPSRHAGRHGSARKPAAPHAAGRARSPEPLTRASQRAQSARVSGFTAGNSLTTKTSGRMPSLTDLRYRAEYMALRLVVALVRIVPIDVGVKVSAKAWRLIARFDRRHQRALDNLAIAFPQKTPQERQAIALAMWENLGRVMAETMQIDRIVADPTRIEIVSQNI